MIAQNSGVEDIRDSSPDSLFLSFAGPSLSESAMWLTVLSPSSRTGTAVQDCKEGALPSTSSPSAFSEGHVVTESTEMLSTQKL